ncbi:GumC family protein [Alteraurantiacibacter palmitatis]|uniref:non-specific protein-tyrosine kinase n=1 Tax=Alteraurantiacibacter palmitatis TaxID=2054628 RepID=A0ABV7E8T0_9SPHN
MQHNSPQGPLGAAGAGVPAFAERFMPGADAVRPAGQQGTLFNLAMIRAMVWRQRLILIGIVGAALLAGFVATLLATPLYQAQTKLAVEPSTSVIVEGQDLATPYYSGSFYLEFMRTLTERIQSRTMALRVVDELNLQDNPDIVGNVADATPERRRELAANFLRGGVAAAMINNTQIIEISFTSTDPALSARLANAYAQKVMMDDVDQSIEANSFARQYLEEQIATVRQQLQDAESQAIAYARGNRIIGQPISGGAAAAGESATATASGTAPTLAAGNVIEVNRQLTTARAARIAAEERWRAVANVPATDLPEVQQNGAIQTLRSQLNDRNARLAELRERYRDDYPPVRELLSEIQTINQSITTLSAEIKASIRSQYEIARRQEAALQQELVRASDASLEEQDRRVEFNQIDRQVASLQTQLASLLDRYNQLSAAANLRSSRFSLLDEATVPRVPSSPNLTRNLLIALVLGLALAVALAVLRETLDDRLRSVEDVENKLGLPALGQTPYTPDETIAELENRFSPISEAYASIRASLDYRLGVNNNLVIQFTSTQPGEGKTTSSAAIATKYAAIGRKVLLVDMDLRRPALSGMFDRPRSDVGVVDVLHGRVALENAVFQPGDSNLDVLPVGEIPPFPVEILSSALVYEFLQKARQRYDVIVVDSSPVLGIADAPLLSRFVDAVVMVIEANRAHARETRAAVRRLQDVNATFAGAILTKFRALEAGQAYNYQYRYYSYNRED